MTEYGDLLLEEGSVGEAKGHVEVPFGIDFMPREVVLQIMFHENLSEFLEVDQPCMGEGVLRGSSSASSWPLVL